MRWEPGRGAATLGGMSATRIVIAESALALAACQPVGGDDRAAPAQADNATIPDPESTEPYAGIGADETVRLTGTEPFWGGQMAGTRLTYTTPEAPAGRTIDVARFAGRGGLSFSGSLDGAALELTVTALACSDGMSDRSYPFTATLKLGDELRSGCGWSERQPFTGPANP